jgi:hypothetical protein
MPINYIGRTLFPHEEQWRQRRRLKTILYTVVTAVVFAAVVGGVMFWLNMKQ